MSWRVAIGSKNDSNDHAGIVLVYRTKDFLSYELLPGVMHQVNGTGMWECVDFFPVSTTADVGLDTSTPAGDGVKHVVKVSLDDDKHDYYAIGTYDAVEDTWRPDDKEMDVGIGLRVDYGKYYASKSFYDEKKQRRVLWGWVGETDSELTDLRKGWASVQVITQIPPLISVKKKLKVFSEKFLFLSPADLSALPFALSVFIFIFLSIFLKRFILNF